MLRMMNRSMGPPPAMSQPARQLLQTVGRLEVRPSISRVRSLEGVGSGVLTGVSDAGFGKAVGGPVVFVHQLVHDVSVLDV